MIHNHTDFDNQEPYEHDDYVDGKGFGVLIVVLAIICAAIVGVCVLLYNLKVK